MRRLPIRAPRIVTAIALVVIACVAGFVPAGAAQASCGYVNPLAGHPWGIYRGGADPLYAMYVHASGARKKTLARMALTPHVRWYTSWIPASKIRAKVAGDIAQEQGGNPNVLVWMAMCRMFPRGESAKMQPLTLTERQAYRRWVDHAARGIGSARVGLVLEPDLPVVSTGWRPSVRYSLVRYAARRFSALPHTTVYLDAGSGDWRNVGNDVAMLASAGIRYVHGFELGSTHHTPTVREVRYGRQISLALARQGFGVKHFIVDTSDNGHGYTWAQFYRKYPGGSYNNAPPCLSKTERVCVSLGIPPTTDVTNPRWGLPASLHTVLQRRCDGFVWVARPWMADNGHHFSMYKALHAARSSLFRP